MKKGDKRRQDKALKQRTERRLAQRRGQAVSRGEMIHLRQARSYPIEGCWTMEGWEKTGIAPVVVARTQPDGNIVFGTFLVDYYCLGVKNAHYEADVPRGRFLQRLPEVLQGESFLALTPELAHEMIYGSIEYAAQFGFRPHRDFRLAQNVLDPPEAHPRTGAVEFGYQGKPFYVNGPYDNVQAILNQLRRTAGEGNFHFLLGRPDAAGDWIEE